MQPMPRVLRKHVTGVRWVVLRVSFIFCPQFSGALASLLYTKDVGQGLRSLTAGFHPVVGS